MNRPNECRWCGCGVQRSLPQATVYQCWSTQFGDTWDQSVECELKLAEDRIQRAVDTLKAANRYTVKAGPRNTLDWDTDPDGYVTDSPAVDEALAILEGERDGETWHPYLEPPSDTRTVILRFDPQGNHDCQGFYSYDFGSYARSEANARRLNFVHPTHWRELTEGEK